jgi:mannose-1-phosphate guanylyltransferase
MRAVVLVGGFGTRLRPLTSTTPKPMLPIGHVPMIARLVDRLGRGGVTEVVLSLGFRPEPFVEAFPDGRCGDVALTYAVEPEPLDTAGAIRFAAEFAGIDDTFVVANGDVMTDLDVSALVDAHRSFGAEATLHLIGVDDPSAFGVVDLADDGSVNGRSSRSRRQEPSRATSSMPVHTCSSLGARTDPAGTTKVSVERDTFPRIVADGGLFGVATDDYWIDAGVPTLYRAANLDLLDGTRRTERCDAVARIGRVVPPTRPCNSIVGDRVHVASGASVVDSVLLPGCGVRRVPPSSDRW